MMVQPMPPNHPLQRLFAGTVQQVLYAEVGMCDPQVADYLTQLLSRFIHVDEFYPFRNAEGRRIEDLAEIVTSADLGEDVSGPTRDRTVHKYIGDFALFWTGVFPEGIRRLSGLSGHGGLHVYLEQGKRSYAIASELTAAPHDKPPADVLRRLSDDFEYCVYGLNLCRQEWQALGNRLPAD